jgi:hypothetical protein
MRVFCYRARDDHGAWDRRLRRCDRVGNYERSRHERMARRVGSCRAACEGRMISDRNGNVTGCYGNRNKNHDIQGYPDRTSHQKDTSALSVGRNLRIIAETD